MVSILFHFLQLRKKSGEKVICIYPLLEKVEQKIEKMLFVFCSTF